MGRDPELRVDQSGNPFATFSIGVSVGTKQAPKTDWVDISCNGKLADIAKNYVRKGTKVLIEGFPTANAYINKENKPVATLRVFANNLELLSKREDEGMPAADYNSSEPVYTLPEHPQNGQQLSSDNLNDIPF